MSADTRDLAEHIGAVTLIDQHVHGCWLAAGDRRRFENALNEANTEPIADSGFDSQLGFAVRAHCAPALGLLEHVDPQAYWDRRRQFAEDELARVFLSAAGVGDWLVDTGIGGGGLAGVGQIARMSGGRAHEIVRLEEVAEQAAQAAGDYAAAFEEILHRRAADAVGTKSILAYRGGFEGDLSEPSTAEVAEAADRWRARGGTRLRDRILLRFGLHQALRLGKPLQFHVGFGDRDCDLHKANPLLLLDFLRRSDGVPIVLLHCYPYEREAGYLAQAFNNVYLDGGLSVNHLGARSPAFLGRLLELAPFSKILYSSDGFGPAELHFLGAVLWRRGLHRVLREFVDRGDWSEADAIRVVDLIARENARRIYGLA
ncbi:MULTISPECIES: amidohydrolase family protein [Mycobacterium avium complex (MAC)]|uniref:Amidohydrolase family protein n=2 Tax=Mycobacterium intracellulare TaxID=1767 RepID=A0AAE4RF51_MYCIT|nr:MULTISPECIES: amidohydrolase family protein [Mycobacterium avium complex (MAC)]AFS14752.1 Protein fluG [Mycobacterium intracellulare subsp. intracellulare MTCC 9506]MCA2321422.1 amidohydrolase family protein [Mycobacterium intracellulare]MCA2342173.1 amidohydrolase family protein [Mycobacterium intracellulare]MDV6976211.1 amidohydrolase family protein [Mycobacterium intracellulare]MDV6981264.1 amidohydrolase family protein [Mycobacterium intracellulare]